jgi:hypothetical protein
MSPPATRATAVAPRPQEAPDRRPNLEVVVVPSRHRRRRRRGLEVLSLVLVIGALVAAVGGHAVLAEAQVHLSVLQSQLSAEQAKNRQLDLSVASLETPSRVVQQAKQRLHMVTPGSVTQLPSVPLQTPLPVPKVAGSPVPTTVPTTVPASVSTTTTARSTSGAAGHR